VPDGTRLEVDDGELAACGSTAPLDDKIVAREIWGLLANGSPENRSKAPADRMTIEVEARRCDSLARHCEILESRDSLGIAGSQPCWGAGEEDCEEQCGNHERCPGRL
jgi:hypothetical protein